MAGDEVDPDLMPRTSGGATGLTTSNGDDDPARAGGLLGIPINPVEAISRATSPGLSHHARDLDDKKRYRPRTFSYFRLMPFEVEKEDQRDGALTGILKNLYVAIRAEDFAPGALHWTRELQGWLNLKFEMTRELRAKLAKIYYHLALAPGLDFNTADRFSRMVVTLTRCAALQLCTMLLAC
jgi:proteasome activator subunit 4